jgi:L-ascorbate metabolism protein UlaG (beta-lactamase superfamily)
MSKQRNQRAILIRNGGQAPQTLRRLPTQEAVKRILQAAMQSSDFQMNQTLMDTLLQLSSEMDVLEEEKTPEWSEEALGPLKAWLENKIPPPTLNPVHIANIQEQSLDGIPMGDAFFRRAEGLKSEWNIKTSISHVMLTHRQQTDNQTNSAQRETQFLIPEDAFRLLSSLSHWSQIEPLAAAMKKEPQWIASWLKSLCDAGFVWFCDFDAGRTLPGCMSTKASDDTLLALAPSISPFPLINGESEQEGPRLLHFMPRGENLHHAEIIGFLFRSYRRGHLVQETQLYGSSQTGAALRLLIARLHGRFTKTQLLSDVPDALRSEAVTVLQTLGDAGLIEAIEKTPAAWAEEEDDHATATWIGHASVLLRYGSTRIWIDPLIPAPHHQTPPSVPSLPTMRGIHGISALLITHGDNDHLNPSTLACLHPDTPVILPDCSDAGPWQVDMRGLLRVMGFHDLRFLKPWETSKIGDTQITAVPFDGEDWGLRLCTLTYLVEGPAQSSSPQKGLARVYLSADSAGNARYGARIRGEAPVDLAFVGVSGNVEAHVMIPGFGYGNFYSPWIPKNRHARFTQLTDGPKEAVKLAVALGAKRSFGYAAGGGAYSETAYSDEGDHETFARLLKEESADCDPVALRPGVPMVIV